MRSNKTAPALVSIMMRILRAYTSGDTNSIETWDFDNEPNATGLHKLVDSQAIIGWDNIFKGRISVEWRHLQTIHLRQTEDPKKPRPAYRTATYWASCLIQQIVYFTLNAWQIRNDKLHDDKVESERAAKRKEYFREMQDWYQRADSSPPDFKNHNLFKMPYLQRKTHSTAMIASWLATVKEQHDYLVRKRAEAEHVERQRQLQRDRVHSLTGGRGTLRGRTRRSGGGRGRGEGGADDSVGLNRFFLSHTALLLRLV